MQIDFYILEESGRQQALRYACQLIEKACESSQKIYIHTDSQQDAERMNDLLWIYRDDTFLPHQIYNPADDSPPPVQIGFGDIPAAQQDVLVNLGMQVPAVFQQFQRVIEIVFSDPHVQQLGRERFRQYRDQGCELNTYKIKANEL
jgi:DNA polymerase-3 subunit chi